MVVQAAVVGAVFLLVAMPVLAPALSRLAGSLWALAGGTGWGGFTSEGQRMTTWGLAWRGFEAEPWSGLGWSGFRIWVRGLPELGRLFGTAHDRALNAFTGSAYNQYLQLLADLGLVGLMAYLVALASAASEAMRALRQTVEPALRAVLVALAGYLAFLIVAGLTDTWMNSGSAATATFFAVMGLGFAAAGRGRGAQGQT
jgi:O-antigen ligase